MSDWNDAALSDTRFDPLLDALVLMARLYENPYSRDSLVAGLPVENGQLDTQQFIVAAERAGLSARLLKRPVEKVSMLLGRCIAPMRQLAGLITRIHGAKAAFSSLEKLMEKPVEMDIHKSYLQKTQFEGAFEFNNVSFAYPEAEVQSLHEVSFKIKPGQKIAVLGRVGSGKSTIGKLLMRYYLPTEGSVYVDGTDIQQINPYDLRRHIGYVPQHIQLFFGAIKENIMIGASWVDDERVARLAGVTDFTDRHPQGLDMPVGEGGRISPAASVNWWRWPGRCCCFPRF